MRRINLKKVNVARSDTIRDINRQIVLNYIRERAPISRAEIAHETALQRSTISLIVEELKARDLVDEIEGESTGGRPPVLLRLRAAGAVAIGVDISIARIVMATSDLAGRVLEREEFAVAPNADENLRQILNVARRFIMTANGSIEGIGISLPGLVDAESGAARFIPHFKWRDWPIARQLSEALHLPVVIENDANAVALAELWFGRPEIREVRNFVLVLVQEGLGTGIVFDGQLYRGVGGAAGEFGHMTIGQGAPVACAAGSHGCWEAFASERAALARYAKFPNESPEQSGKSFALMLDQAEAGDAEAVAALLKTAYFLGVGISNLIKGLSPDAVIVTGQIARAWPLIAVELRRAVDENSICRGLSGARIMASTLGEDPSLMGALSLVLVNKFAPAQPG